MDDALTAQSSLSRIASLPSLDIDIESAAFLESVLNASSDCIKVLSLDGELLFMNGGGLKVMEVDDFDTVRGCNWTSFWEGDNHSVAANALAIASAGNTGKFTGQSNTARGTPRWWDVMVTPILDASGTTPTHLLAISRDITEAKVAQLQRELLT